MTEFSLFSGFFTLGGLETTIVLFFGAFALLSFVFWLWMLIDCLTKEPSEGNDKIVWVLVVFFGNLLGAAIYFFARRPERIRVQGH